MHRNWNLLWLLSALCWTSAAHAAPWQPLTLMLGQPMALAADTSDTADTGSDDTANDTGDTASDSGDTSSDTATNGDSGIWTTGSTAADLAQEEGGSTFKLGCSTGGLAPSMAWLAMLAVASRRRD